MTDEIRNKQPEPVETPTPEAEVEAKGAPTKGAATEGEPAGTDGRSGFERQRDG